MKNTKCTKHVKKYEQTIKPKMNKNDHMPSYKY